MASHMASAPPWLPALTDLVTTDFPSAERQTRIHELANQLQTSRAELGTLTSLLGCYLTSDNDLHRCNALDILVQASDLLVLGKAEEGGL